MSDKPAKSKRKRASKSDDNGKALSKPRNLRETTKRETGLAKHAELSVVEIANLPLSVVEREILRLVNVERADPSEIGETLAALDGTSWPVERVGRVLEQARAKLVRAGELDAARPSEYASADARLRYDAIVRGLRAELARVPESPEFALMRAKLYAMIGDAEQMRDGALLALGGKAPGQGPSALVYVSHLRPDASARAIPGEAMPKTVPGTPPGRGRAGSGGSPSST